MLLLWMKFGQVWKYWVWSKYEDKTKLADKDVLKLKENEGETN